MRPPRAALLSFFWVFCILFISVLGTGGDSLKKLKNIKSPDGDIIDCVSIRKQPAFDHPLLQNSKLQTFPSNATAFKSLAAATANKIQQLWHQTGQRCPPGTIPVRRFHSRGVVHHRKSNGPPQPASSSQHQPLSSQSSRQHEHAIAFVEGVFYGAQAIINVWDPTVEGPDEFSLSQVWVLSGTFNYDLNSVEAGWQVNPALYGDRNPRFFTYWTSDSYRSTGCYNLLCQGFVQINSEVVLGGAVAPVSTFNGAQYDIHILIFKACLYDSLTGFVSLCVFAQDFITGNWWLRYGDQLIGYWPSELFTHLRSFANVIEWGGEVVNTQPNNRHTGTQMGSGRYPQAGFAGASYMKSLQVVDFTSLLRGPSSMNTLSTRGECYNIRGSSTGPYFFGGPGLSSSCS